MIIGISGKKNTGKDTVADYIVTTLAANKKIQVKKIQFADKLKDIVCLLLNCSREALEDREFKEKELGPEWWVIKFPNSQIIPYLGDYPSFYKKYDVIKLTPRLLLQLLGTECGRRIIHPDIWVNATFAEYKPQHFRTVKYQGSFVEHLTTMPNWIISDVRFPNEAEAIKDKGGILIRVERFCYDSSEDFLVCNPDPELRKIGIQDYNINKTLSLEEITGIAKIHGYIPLSEQHESETALDNYTKFDHIITNNGTIENLHKEVEKILLSI